VSEPAWKGWRATRARVPLRLRVADHAFLAFYLPAGESDVVLRYLPSGFVYGSIVSALALLSSAITFFMSAHTSFFAEGVRSR
ncbi:MAG TPA: YfhO family protein, partial [Thermoanaerobaculia bacterium]|nr:YfhO family protein [Thermoanaerobaculia bacterium]